MLRRLAGEEATRVGVRVSADDVAQHANRFCHRLGLTDQASFDAWLADNQLTVTAFNALVESELRGRIALADIHRCVQTELPDTLRMIGSWPALARRAAHKIELLVAAGLADPGLENTPFANENELGAWWVTQNRPGHGAVDDVSEVPDIKALSRAADFTSQAAFVQALLREYCARALGLTPPNNAGPDPQANRDFRVEGPPS
jgi:hypothetical protein